MQALPKAYDYRGSSMGRRDTITEPLAPCRFHLCRLRMSADGCYDQGGAYWGHGAPLYRAYCDDNGDELFMRASTRDEAKRTVRAQFPNATFWR